MTNKNKVSSDKNRSDEVPDETPCYDSCTPESFSLLPQEWGDCVVPEVAS